MFDKIGAGIGMADRLYASRRLHSAHQTPKPIDGHAPDPGTAQGW